MRARRNQIFGSRMFPEDMSSNNLEFEGTNPVLISTYPDSPPMQIEVCAYPHSHLHTCFSKEHGAYSYVWGIPAHPSIPTADIPKWCAKVAAKQYYDRFRELLGPFVLVVDQPAQRRITFVTDVLGVRPMFLGRHNGRIVFGSDVWALYKAGVTNGTIDYDAVSSWIAYGYNCTNGSLFSDLPRLPPGSAVIFQDGRCTEIPYAEFQPGSKLLAAEQVSEDLHHIVSSTVKTLLANHPRVLCSLSGGYDSRYLVALSSSLAEVSVKCATVGDTEEEGHIASQVAHTLGLPIETIPVRGSIWDVYDNVYHFSADGFPISKSASYCVAQLCRDIPIVNGFMGDNLIRGSRDSILGKYETEWSGADMTASFQQKYLLGSMSLFHKDIAKRILIRSRRPMEEAVQKGAHVGKALTWTDFYHHRHYISNNFLQHIGITEALVPFYSWTLLSYKMGHDYRVFSRDIYQRIFNKYFPKLAGIPHSSDLISKQNRPFRSSRCTKRWALQLLPVILKKKWLSLLSRKWCVPRNIAGIVGLTRVERTVLELERLYWLEKAARDNGISFDWECV